MRLIDAQQNMVSGLNFLFGSRESVKITEKFESLLIMKKNFRCSSHSWSKVLILLVGIGWYSS